ncbi:hypothetical protein GGR56DRAFT_672300 [Xylariaceae sp. FL0804]|nr:hypothetical protein GGR56DRAFT_672300 [Xylariaceae sp. FL0804]
MPHVKTFNELMPSYGLQYIQHRPHFLDTHATTVAMKRALTSGLTKPDWRTTMARLEELFTTALELSYLIRTRGLRSFWEHLAMTVSWTKDQAGIEPAMVRSLAMEVIQARVRAARPEFYAQAHDPKFVAAAGLLEPLDELIRYWHMAHADLFEFAPAENKEASTAAAAAAAAAAAKPDTAMNMDEALGEISAIAGQAGHDAMRMKVTQEKMEDMDIDEKEEAPEDEGPRRLFKTVDRNWEMELRRGALPSKKMTIEQRMEAAKMRKQEQQEKDAAAAATAAAAAATADEDDDMMEG